MQRTPVFLALLVAIAVCAIFVDALRLGFFSDDWLLLDAARRAPLLAELLGQHGVWPWYRPLSREAYFLAIVAAGPLGVVVARTLALAAVVASACALFRLAPRAFAGGGGAIAAALFVTFAHTKALAAWASGFQDLAAAAFTLTSLWALARGRRPLALVLAACAMFSKETGFVIAPLLVGWELLVERRRPPARWLGALIAVTAAALAAHALVRTTWPLALRHAAASVASDPGAVVRFPWTRLAEFFAGFWMAGTPPGALAAGLGIVAGLAAAGLVWTEPRTPGPRRTPLPTVPRGLAFALAALLLGLAPAVIGQALGLAMLQPWHAFPALGGACLLVAGLVGRASRPVQAVALAALVAVNVWGQSYVTPRPEEIGAGAPPARGWQLQVRDEARTRKLERDVRRLLADRPESLVVLYERLPFFSYLQTADGPATREMLGDPTVRTYYLGDAPRGLRPERLRILVGVANPVGLRPMTTDEALFSAVANLLRGEARPARALLARLRADGPLDPGFAYLDAIASGVDEGPAAYLEALRAAGLGDSSAAGAGRAADLVGKTLIEVAGVRAAYHEVFSRPTSSRAHAAAAESLLAHAAAVPSAIEWRLAGALEPGWSIPRQRVDSLFSTHRIPGDAR